jgi:hypothetical protein
MFRALLVHHQRAHSCVMHLLNIFCMYQSCWKFLWNPDHQAAPIPVFSIQLSLLHTCESQITMLLQFLFSVHTLVFYMYITHLGVLGSSATYRKCKATVLCNSVLPVDGPLWPKTCRSWFVIKSITVIVMWFSL